METSPQKRNLTGGRGHRGALLSEGKGHLQVPRPGPAALSGLDSSFTAGCSAGSVRRSPRRGRSCVSTGPRKSRVQALGPSVGQFHTRCFRCWTSPSGPARQQPQPRATEKPPGRSEPPTDSGGAGRGAFGAVPRACPVLPGPGCPFLARLRQSRRVAVVGGFLGCCGVGMAAGNFTNTAGFSFFPT